MKTKYLLLAVLGLSAWGCAKENTPSTGETSQSYLNLWMDKYHPGITHTSAGLYILEDKPGTGALWNYENDYAYVEVTVRTLNGTISSTTDKTLSRQLGTYVKGNYYGPRFQAIGDGYSYAGFDALLDGMKEGGERTAVVPAWMLTTKRYNTQQEYINASSISSSLIYSVKFDGQTDDVAQVEKDSLRRYVTRHFGNVAPVTYKTDESADGTFYFISDVSGFTEDDARGETDNATINYTGRLLNGQVFDTTIEKVAKDAGIYNASKTYAPVSVTFSSSWDSISMSGSSTLIDGFKGGLSLMKFVGQKAVVVFTSAHGYTSTGSGDTIPAWSPLQFELELVTDENLE
jgi:FKBP-type peptidyl-prolyl cis-trans isomerase FklB